MRELIVVGRDQPACFIVKDKNGQALGYFYYEGEQQGRPAPFPLAGYAQPRWDEPPAGSDSNRAGSLQSEVRQTVRKTHCKFVVLGED